MPQDLPSDADEVGSPVSGIRIVAPITADDIKRLIGSPFEPPETEADRDEI